MALTLPLLPPPQKNRSPPSDSKSRHAHSGRHFEPIQHLARSRIDAPQIAFITRPGAVPELAVDPGDTGDDAVALDGAKDRPRLRIDLMDLAAPTLSHPKRPFGPCEPRVAAAGRRDRGDHAPGVRIDFLDAILGDLKEVPAVKSRSRMRGNGDRAHQLSARGIEGVEPVSGRKPDMPAVKRYPVDLFGIRKGPYSRRIRLQFHASILVTRQRTGE